MKALLVLLAMSAPALADDRSLLHCRTIADVAGRVACYDAIPVAAAGAPPGPAIAAPAAVAPAPATAAPSAAPAASPQAGFGQEMVAQRKAETPSSLESTVVGRIEGWGPTTQFTLANGQVWRVADDSSASFTERTNPRVVLSRNAIGTIFLEFDGAKQAPRVRRVR